uniref:hypothetical protein n=1 Tax=Eubacterium sp. TaxID=142586 RepID=UPI0040280543
MNRKDFENAMKNKCFKEVLPETYNELKEWTIDELIGGDRTITSESRLHNKDNVLTEIRDGESIENLKDLIRETVWDYETLKSVFYCDYSNNDSFRFFEGYEMNEDFKQLLELFSEYKNVNYKDYIDEKGNLDYFRFSEDTELYGDILTGIYEELLNDEDVKKRFEEVNEEWQNEFREVETEVKALRYNEDLDDFINRFESEVGKDTPDRQSRNIDDELEL